MRLKLSIHQSFRLLSVFVLFLLNACDCFMPGAWEPEKLCVSLFCASELLILYPASRDSYRLSLSFYIAAVLLFMTFKLLQLPSFAFALAGTLLCFVFLVFKGVVKYAEVTTLFHSSAVWAGVQDYLYMMHAAAFLLCGIVTALLPLPALLCWIWAAFMLFFYVLQYYRVYTRRTLFLSHKKEMQIRRHQGAYRARTPVQYVDSDSRSAQLFNDVVRIMESKKPYLQDDFGVDDLSRMAHTNRMYLSRAINFHSGRNFNQLVNYYRVKYAVELLRKDTRLRMNELSQMCGFHTVVSFNMAFKLNEQMTPSEYVRSLKAEAMRKEAVR